LATSGVLNFYNTGVVTRSRRIGFWIYNYNDNVVVG
jgi:hypothetical protein